MEAIPQTPNGKTDRLHLPLPPRARPELDTPFAPAETLAEKELAQIWAEVLDLEEIGIHDNFFDLGGNSLLATRIAARALKNCRVALPIRALFESPTIAELAKTIAPNQARTVADDEIAELLAELESQSVADTRHSR
jgi:hypothetical protein